MSGLTLLLLAACLCSAVLILRLVAFGKPPMTELDQRRKAWRRLRVRRMSDRALTYHDATRVLIEGVCGANIRLLTRETGVSTKQLIAFMQRTTTNPQDATVEAIGQFVWRRLNAHLLLCDEDREPSRVDPDDPHYRPTQQWDVIDGKAVLRGDSKS